MSHRQALGAGSVSGEARLPEGEGGRAGLRVWRIFVAAVVVVAALVVGAGTASADVLFSDGFESGDFSAWTLVKTGGDGSAVVQSSIVNSGSYAAELSESSNAGSKAYVRKTFATAQQDLTATGDFQVLQEGASGGNVPFFCFFTSGGTRIITLYRQNVNGKIRVGYGGGNFATGATVALGTWANVQLHVVIAGASSTVEVSLNGTLIYQTISASLGTSGVSIVQIGNGTAAQAGTLVADDINVQNGGPLSPPSNTAPPAIAGEALQGQTLTASQGSWSGTQPVIFAYQWQRCDTSGANCANVGSGSSTYTLTSADVGSTIAVAVTASNSAGSATVVPAATAVVQASSNTLFSDGFESGDFSAWTVKTGGDGSAVVQSSIVKSGSYAAELSETSNSGSLAYVRATLASGQLDLTANGDFQVLQQGASGGNVPFFRFFTSGGTRIITLYRQNVSGKIQVGYGGANFATGATLALSTWANVQLHVTIAGTASTVEVILNGTLIYSTASAGLGTAAAASIQLGNERAAQAFTLVADNITAQTSNTGPPVNTAPPAISGSAQQGQTLTATPGSWSGAQPISYAYQWQRCDASGANCANVGAGDSTYTLTSADVGSTIAVAVTATNSAGSATVVSTATAVVQASSVVALWHMDETSGTTMFDTAGQNNGTLHSVTLGLPGFSGFAYGFNGSSSYVSVPSAASMNPGSANFSFTIALRTTGTPPPPPEDWDLIRKGDYTTKGGEYKMEFQHSGQASCGFKGSATYAEIQAGPALNDGNWHTITCVKTAFDIELTVDGQTFTTPATIGSISNTDPVLIGTHPGSDWYQGSLDEANISIGS